MLLMNDTWTRLKKNIEESKCILLSTHRNPDADGLGSEIAFYNFLKKSGKDCRIINISEMSDNCTFLDPDNIVEVYNVDNHKDWISKADLAIIFDIGDYKRLGEISSLINHRKCLKVTIDHHPSDDSFFDLKIIDITSAATGFMVWQFFQFLNIQNYDIVSANALYAALISDTGSFRYNSTTSDCHIMAKNLLDQNVEPYYVYSNLYEQKKINQIQLFSIILDNIKYHHNSEFACVKVTSDMFETSKTSPDDVEGIADFVRSIKGVEVSFILSEMPDNSVKVNFRSRGKYIINDIAKSLNGGGHKLAAGASVHSMSLNQIEEKILDQLITKSKELHVNKI